MTEEELREAEAAAYQASAAKDKAEADLFQVRTRVELLNEKWTQSRWDDEEAAASNHGLFDFSGQVMQSNVSSIIKMLGEFSRREPGRDITIVLNSPGGGVFAGLSLYDYIQTLRSVGGHKVTMHTIGTAASMGGVLLQAGDERVAGRNSYMLIHEVSNATMGKTSEMEDDLKFQKKLQGGLLEILAERSTLSVAQIRTRWVKKDWWLNSEEMLKLGFVDRIQ